MNQISPVATAPAPVSAVSQTVATSSSSQRQLTRSVAQAVGQLNETGVAGEGREVSFSVDRATRLPIVKVIDSTTKEVIDQWPTEYALQLAESNAVNSTRDSG